MNGQEHGNLITDSDFPNFHENESLSFPALDFYDFNGNFCNDKFQKLTGMTYHNYLRSHDDMI